VERSIDADRVVATLDRLAVQRGAPAFVRFDNGPEFIGASEMSGVGWGEGIHLAWNRDFQNQTVP
jgi:hypothetical protein